MKTILTLLFALSIGLPQFAWSRTPASDDLLMWGYDPYDYVAKDIMAATLAIIELRGKNKISEQEKQTIEDHCEFLTSSQNPTGAPIMKISEAISKNLCPQQEVE